jgi:hypothetical protein
MELRDLSRIATDLTLTTVKWPIAPAARAVGLQHTVDHLDGRARGAVGRWTGDTRLQADARVLRAPGYRLPASAVQSSETPRTDSVALS